MKKWEILMKKRMSDFGDFFKNSFQIKWWEILTFSLEFLIVSNSFIKTWEKTVIVQIEWGVDCILD